MGINAIASGFRRLLSAARDAADKVKTGEQTAANVNWNNVFEDLDGAAKAALKLKDPRLALEVARSDLQSGQHKAAVQNELDQAVRAIGIGNIKG